jgi:diguanylate cyclase (GGDEF)-like protein/PAS domain S-box-containing protein
MSIGERRNLEHLGDLGRLQERLAELETIHSGLSRDLSFSRSANRFLNSVLDAIAALVVVIDANGQLVRLNQPFLQTVAEPGQRLEGKYFWEMLLLPDDAMGVQLLINKVLRQECRTTSGNYWLTKNGNLRLISWSFTGLKGSGGQIEYIVGIGQDNTEREQAEEDLRISKERYRLLFENVNDAVFVYSLTADGNKKKLIEVNEVACQRLGYQREDLLRLLPDAFEKPANTALTPLIALKLQQQKHALFEAVHTTKNGEQIPVEVNAHLFDIYGQTAVLSVARDITERKEMEEKLRFMTMHDSLTGLYNRAYFDEEIRRLATARHLNIGVLVCDVDGLKLINDSMGHQAGDEILKAAGIAIASAIREGDFVARIGGDEFAVILPGISADGIQNVISRIRDTIAACNQENPGLPLSISIGWALASRDNQDIQQLIKQADDNMYREKLHHSQSTRSELVHGLKKALEARDFMTEGHSKRLADLTARLGKTIGLAERDLAELRLLAQFHDFGKVGIPDSILFKPSRLTEEEYHTMKRHCEIGHRIAKSVPDLTPIADRILKHHEWWNGDGYPLGLAGNDIPLDCRVLAIVDAYDAMTSDRPYRKAMSPEVAQAELLRCKGSQFDPAIVDSFLAMVKQ